MVSGCAAGLRGRVASPALLLNTTASLPLGLYRVRSPTPPLTYGMLVVFPAPPSVAGLIVARGWLPPQIPLLKPLAALPGDSVCVTADGLTINHRRVGSVAAVDSQGRPLPRWQGCRVLTPDEVFPASLDQRRSFDGRYFGPILIATIHHIAEPVWTFTW